MNRIKREHSDFPIGSVVVYTKNKQSLNLGIVVKHTKIKMTLITAYNSYSHRERFYDISRYPDECVPVGPREVENVNNLEQILIEWNRINKTDLTLKFN